MMKRRLSLKRMQDAELGGSRPAACPGGRGPGFRLRAGLRLGTPMPLTKGFNAAAEQLLHCTALVQV